MKKYNIINNSLGWLCFIIAAVTYLLTMEPTASFWDCPEFISQGYKLEVGHPPGNPIFMLAARFCINFVGGNPEYVSLAVNAMSALLSAGTILLLFWTITHLTRRLLVKDGSEEISLTRMMVIFGSGLCGALVYTWSDTFWFSAAEAEVYAFSSFCTALVFWLILKWENRADQPHSDRYLILIAYVIGISIAVHLLNLLCIPAIVLVFYYRKYKNTNAKGSLIALGISVVIVGLILYGLVPGFVEMAQYFELFAVNTIGLSYNYGTLMYAIVLVGVFIWTIYELYTQNNALRIKLSFVLSVILSGIPFIGDSMWIPIIVIAGLVWYFFLSGKKLHIRILNIIATGIFVIFIGYSSYALLLIRSSANTPMNQNSPDNVFALASYLNREQYGDRPLFYGQTFNSSVLYEMTDKGFAAKKNEGRMEYAKKVKSNPNEPDEYVETGRKYTYEFTPELNMFFPRMYSSKGSHIVAYKEWTNFKDTPSKRVKVTSAVDKNGKPIGRQEEKFKPSFADNMKFFFTYQLNHMYWRYFMWNFAGRQNDIQGNGEVNHGNWISGISFIDDARLGDQSLLPDELGKGNKGHNVFFMLPLLLGLLGLLWQAFVSKRGIEQFWVVFFLFFMTGIAIVIYLNQTPGQPRERDYAFAGSFYAFAIWVGMGVAALWNILKGGDVESDGKKDKANWVVTGAVCLVGLAVPLQMVSQTWDDHDRSGRYTARDFGMNYLSSLDENAIIFSNGDNDTFPLWYAQEVEGYRTDVKVVNLSYLTTPWYANQVKMPTYDSPAIKTLATEKDYAYDRIQFAHMVEPVEVEMPLLEALKHTYSDAAYSPQYKARTLSYPALYIDVDSATVVNAGRVSPSDRQDIVPKMSFDLRNSSGFSSDGGLSLSGLLSLDMIGTNAANGWERPIYFAMTVPSSYYMGLTDYMRSTGMAYEVTPTIGGEDGSGYMRTRTDKMYENVTTKFRWGGLDKVENEDDIYLDETTRRMVATVRTSLLELVHNLQMEAIMAQDAETPDSLYANDRFEKAREILNLIKKKLPEEASPYGIQIGRGIAEAYLSLGEYSGNQADVEEGLRLLADVILDYSQYIRYLHSLTPEKYNTVPRADRYIPVYIAHLLMTYQEYGGDGEALLDAMQAMGVDINRWSAEVRSQS